MFWYIGYLQSFELCLSFETTFAQTILRLAWLIRIKTTRNNVSSIEGSMLFLICFFYSVFNLFVPQSVHLCYLVLVVLVNQSISQILFQAQGPYSTYKTMRWNRQGHIVSHVISYYLESISFRRLKQWIWAVHYFLSVIIHIVKLCFTIA